MLHCPFIARKAFSTAGRTRVLRAPPRIQVGDLGRAALGALLVELPVHQPRPQPRLRTALSLAT